MMGPIELFSVISLTLIGLAIPIAVFVLVFLIYQKIRRIERILMRGQQK
ncbi:MAG: hypothetical protein ACOX5R_18890 [bacterium]|jgi:hypothetical protein